MGGGRLFDISTGFFYENGHNSGTKSPKIVPKVGNEASLLNQAKIGPLIKIGVVWQDLFNVTFVTFVIMSMNEITN